MLLYSVFLVKRSDGYELIVQSYTYSFRFWSWQLFFFLTMTMDTRFMFIFFFFSLKDCKSNYLYVPTSENDIKTCPGEVGKAEELIQHAISYINGSCQCSDLEWVTVIVFCRPHKTVGSSNDRIAPGPSLVYFRCSY